MEDVFTLFLCSRVAYRRRGGAALPAKFSARWRSCPAIQRSIMWVRACASRKEEKKGRKDHQWREEKKTLTIISYTKHILYRVYTHRRAIILRETLYLWKCLRWMSTSKRKNVASTKEDNN